MIESASAAARPPIDARIRRDDERSCGVDQVMRMSGTAAVEVYVGWNTEPVHVAFRGYRSGAETWAVVGPRLKERVMLALGPLLIMGWQINGVFSQSVRWDMSKGVGGDLYEGCWVQIRRIS
jgi:hypothetical protein